jgi:hypothetical protein
MKEEPMTSSPWARVGLSIAGCSALIFAAASCFPPPGVRVTGPMPPRASVTVNATPAPAPSIVTAPELASTGAVANGMISYPSQRVRYPISITYPRVISIYVAGMGLDPTAALYDAFGNRLAYNDDGGGNLNSQITYTLSPGSYIIEVGGYGSSTGQFQLTVN